MISAPAMPRPAPWRTSRSGKAKIDGSLVVALDAPANAARAAA
jgi:hypothetical protein